MKPWEKYASKDTQSLDGPWAKYAENVSPKEEPGLLSQAAELGSDVLTGVGTAVDYFDAPIRQAIAAPAKMVRGHGIVNSLTDIPAQLGSDPSEAPSFTQIAEMYGIDPRRQKVSSVSIANPMAAFNSDEMIPEEEKVERPSPAELTGAVADTVLGGAGLGLIGKGLSRTAKGLAAPLKATAEASAFKQAGGMLGDFRRAEGKGRLGQLGRAVLDEKVNLPDGSVVPLYKAGDKVEDVAKKAEILKSETGKQIGGVYSGIDEAIANASPEKLKKVFSYERFDPSADAGTLREIISDKFGKKLNGEKVMAAVDPILENMAKRGNSLEETHALRRELDEMVNYAKQTQDLPATQQALKQVRDYVQKKTNKYASEVADVLDLPLAKDLEGLNKKYSNIAEIADISTDKVARNRANRLASPSDYLTGVAGAMTLGPKGLLLGVGNKVARERGAGLLAKGADALSGRAGGLTGDIPMSLSRATSVASNPGRKRGK